MASQNFAKYDFRQCFSIGNSAFAITINPLIKGLVFAKAPSKPLRHRYARTLLLRTCWFAVGTPHLRSKHPACYDDWQLYSESSLIWGALMKEIAQASVKNCRPAYRQEVSVGGFAILSDEPTIAGGQGVGPAPYDYILAGLGSCTSITLQMYADRKGWVLDGLRIELTLSKDEQGDTFIERVVSCKNALTAEQWKKLLNIAGKTPVTRTILSGAKISTTNSAHYGTQTMSE